MDLLLDASTVCRDCRHCAYIEELQYLQLKLGIFHDLTEVADIAEIDLYPIGPKNTVSHIIMGHQTDIAKARSIPSKSAMSANPTNHAITAGGSLDSLTTFQTMAPARVSVSRPIFIFLMSWPFMPRRWAATVLPVGILPSRDMEMSTP